MTIQPTISRGRICRRSILLAGFACLILRAVIPAGYMPGNLLAGEFMVLCPNGLPPAVMRSLHMGHHDHGQNVVDVDRSCPIGSALQPAWIPTDDTLLPLVLAVTVRFAPVYVDRVPEASRRQYDSRAPPRA